jgi:sarcosine oxidase subunit gamma
MISFQIHRFSAGAAATLRQALGFELPSRPNTATSEDGVHCLWTTPHRWLIDCGVPRSQLLLAALSAPELGHTQTSELTRATNCSDSFDSFQLDGDSAVHVLAKGCPLDLRCQATPSGSALRTRFADTAVIVHKVSARRFRLHTDVSLSDYLWAWLTDACAEFESPELPR